MAGGWDLLGARELLVQRNVIDGLAFVPDTELSSAPKMPDWQRIAGEPWARDVILGVAGSFDETEARSQPTDRHRSASALHLRPAENKSGLRGLAPGFGSFSRFCLLPAPSGAGGFPSRSR